jgi:hypothetical protein
MSPHSAQAIAIMTPGGNGTSAFAGGGALRFHAMGVVTTFTLTSCTFTNNVAYTAVDVTYTG